MHRFVEKLKKENEGDTMLPYLGAFSPLFLGIPWTAKDGPCNDPLDYILVNKGRETLVVCSQQKYERHASFVFRKYLDKHLSLENLKSIYNEPSNLIKDLYNQYINFDLKLLDDQAIAELMSSCSRVFGGLVGKSLYIETFDKPVALSVCNQEEGLDLNSVWAEAVHPRFESFDSRRRRLLKDIVKKFGVSSEGIRRASFIFTDYFSVKDDDEIREALSKIDLSDADPEEAEIDNNWDGKLNEREKSIYDYTQFVMELRDIRKDPIAMTQALFALISKEMLRRAGLPEVLSPHLSSAEYAKGVDWLRQNKTDILKRSDGVIVYLSDRAEGESCDYDQVRKELETLLNFQKNETEVHGQTASKGLVRGVARIILDPNGVDSKSFSLGDILMTSMTRPEFVPLMKIAGAVVTNEGGVTCHAAIISRELGIPCVIATKVATQIFKDGDMVEVDADNGIVKKI